MAAWKKAVMVAKLKPEGMKHPSLRTCFLRTPPTNMYNRLADEHFETGCRILAKRLKPKKYVCQHADTMNLHLESLTPEKYTDHILTCNHCGALQFVYRHERVNNVIHRILKFSGVTSVLNPKGLPLPDKTKGGADLTVMTMGKTQAVDVAITKNDSDFTVESKLKRIEMVKFRNYERFKRVTGFDIVPFVMSVYGEHGECARNAAKEWALMSASTTTFIDILTFTQHELIRGIHNGLEMLHARVQAPVDRDAAAPIVDPEAGDVARITGEDREVDGDTRAVCPDGEA